MFTDLAWNQNAVCSALVKSFYIQAVKFVNTTVSSPWQVKISFTQVGFVFFQRKGLANPRISNLAVKTDFGTNTECNLHALPTYCRYIHWHQHYREMTTKRQQILRFIRDLGWCKRDIELRDSSQSCPLTFYFRLQDTTHRRENEHWILFHFLFACSHLIAPTLS